MCPAVAGRDGVSDGVEYFLSTLEPSNVVDNSVLNITVDGKIFTLKQGEDFWISTVAKLSATKTLSWAAL